MNGSEHLIILAVQKRLVQKFRDACSTLPKQAATLEELGVRRSVIFKKMEKRGIFRTAEGGRYYLDEDAADRHFRRAKIGMIAALMIALFFLLLYLIFGVWLG